MANEIYIDTSGFYSLLIKDDDRHAAANAVLQSARVERRRLITTDHVLAETANLLKARRKGHVLDAFFTILEDTKACRTEWTDEQRFQSVRSFLLKHADQSWSFTDCLSFVVMKEFRLQDSLTKDIHFEQAGFIPLLK